MKILIAEDDPVSRRVLEATLQKWNHEVIVTEDGERAWAQLGAFQSGDPDAPRLAILDWNMPGLDGVEVCRRLRERSDGDRLYVIILTARTQTEDCVAGLRAGADDFLTKPFHHEELRARVDAGCRIIDLQGGLAAKIEELERALAEVQTLSGLLPICAYCKRVRDGQDYWAAVEEYVACRTDAQFSHGVCPECYDRIVRPQVEDE